MYVILLPWNRADASIHKSVCKGCERLLTYGRVLLAEKLGLPTIYSIINAPPLINIPCNIFNKLFCE